MNIKKTKKMPSLQQHEKRPHNHPLHHQQREINVLIQKATYSNSFLSIEPNLNTIGSVPTNTTILFLNGEHDTQTPVEGALFIAAKAYTVKSSDHTLITYPNLGHEFHPSSQRFTQNGPVPEYVLADLYSWLESRSGLAELGVTNIMISSLCELYWLRN